MALTKRMVAYVSVMALYGAFNVTAIRQNWPHYELLNVIFQFCVLLPVCCFALLQPPADCDLFSRSLNRRAVYPIVAVFVAGSAFLSWRVSQGMLISDENAYRFEARTVAMGHLVAPMPPGAVNAPAPIPRPLSFLHVIYFNGWYFKYPLGWPLLLALPERFELEWLVNPVCGLLLLLAIAGVTKEIYGERVAPAAVALAVLSPYFLANIVGLMAHGLCAALIAFACLAWLRAVRTGKLSQIALMFALLVVSIHVRIFTGAIAAVVLGASALIAVRQRRPLFWSTLGVAAIAFVTAVVSMLVYNYVFTGNALLSPYALSRGITVPAEVSTHPGQILQNIRKYRGSAEATVCFSFPLIFCLAGYGFWVTRREHPAAAMLLALFAAMVVAHFVQPEYSASVVGERYWFEGYVSIVVLAAGGIARLFETCRPARALAAALVGAALVVQAATMVTAGFMLDRLSSPQRAIESAASRYRDCDCVIFVSSAPPLFPQHFMLNRPDWYRQRSFQAVDPGPGERSRWTGILGKRNWVLIEYISETGRAVASKWNSAS
jgi:hypothetical protein